MRSTGRATSCRRPGGPTKQRIGPERSFFSFETARYSMIRSFTFSRSKWSSSRIWRAWSRSRLSSVNARPGQREDPVEVGADDAVLGGGRRQLLEPRSARAAPPLRRARAGPSASICPRSSLISACWSSPSPSSSWIAFSCCRRKNSRWPLSISLATCDWIFEPSSDISTSRPRIGAIRRSRSSTSAVSSSSCRSSVFSRSVEAIRWRERARVVDVRGGELQLLGQVRRHPDDLRELLLHGARQRLDLGRVRHDLRQILELGDEVRLVLRPARRGGRAGRPGRGSAASRRAP